MVDRIEEQAKALLEGRHPDELRAFLRNEFDTNPALQERFIAYVDSKKKTVYDYRKEIDQQYEYCWLPNFDEFRGKAKYYADQGSFLDAATIYRALFESMGEHLHDVGIYEVESLAHHRQYKAAIANYATCLRRANLCHEDKQTYIKYMFSEYLDNRDDFPQYYEDALWEICTSEEDLQYWLDHVRSKVNDEIDLETDELETHSSRQLLSLYVDLLDRLNKCKELCSVLDATFLQQKELSLQYAQHLENNGEREQAIQLVEEAINEFDDDTVELREFATNMYNGVSPEKYKEQLQALFLLEHDWAYYEQLRAACTENEWKTTVDEIIDQLSDDYTETKANIYFREKRIGDAFTEVVECRDLDLLKTFLLAYIDIS